MEASEQQRLAARYRLTAMQSLGVAFFKSAAVKSGFSTADNPITAGADIVSAGLGLTGVGAPIAVGVSMFGQIARLAQNDMEEGIADEVLAINPDINDGKSWSKLMRGVVTEIAAKKAEEFDKISEDRFLESKSGFLFSQIKKVCNQTIPDFLRKLNPLRKSPIHILNDHEIAAKTMAVEDARQILKIIEKGELQQFIDPNKADLGITQNPEAAKKATDYLVAKVASRELPSPDAEKPLTATQIAPHHLEHAAG